MDGKAVPVPELITDKKGYALSPELPYGLYVVEESTVPENLKAIDPFLVKVDEDSREPMVWRVFDDRPFEFLLKIVKKDAQTGNPVLKAGASYKIFDMEKEEYVEQTVFYPKKETISVFKTNEEGLKCYNKVVTEVANKCLLIKQLSVTSNSYICSGHTRIGTDAKEHKVFASES